jgi:CYTH domain-containing protein/thymidylate kinase
MTEQRPAPADQTEGQTHTPEPVIFHVAVDGGPCAGKSTALTVIPERINSRGIGCLVAREASTDIIISGFPIQAALAALPDDPSLMMQLNRAIMSTQLHWFKVYDDLARVLSAAEGRPYVVLHDRAVATNQAYVGQESFDQLLTEMGITLHEARDRYDLVAFMVTAAIGAEHAYSDVNNASRMETPEQARELDERTRAAWHGHEHLKMFDNSTDFDDKINRVEREILNLFGEPPLEHEIKLLLSRMPDAELLGAAVETEIRQTYMVGSGEVETRVRESRQGAHLRYSRTVKELLPSGARSERGRTIPNTTYRELLAFADPELATVVKTRHSFTSSRHYFELDEFHVPDGVVLLEIEVASMDEHVELPDWLQELVVANVTHDPAYKSRALARTAIDVGAKP